jgi:hypothetical protein
LKTCNDLQRRPVLLVDNIGLVFKRLDNSKKNKQGQWALRKLLSENGAPIIISAGPAVTDDVINYAMPFYDFFQIQYLRKLSFEEFSELLENLANRTQINIDIIPELRKEKPRLQTLYHFTGGNPRTAVMLFKLLVKGFSADVADDLDALVDEVTPLYKSKLEELPPQQQIIIDAIAMNWHAIPFRKLASDTDLAINLLSSQLNRLLDDGWIEKVKADKKSREINEEVDGIIKGSAYFISERFFNTWFLMRRSNRRDKKGIHSLSEFLECLYGRERLEQETDRLLQSEITTSRQIILGLSLAESAQLDPERKNKLDKKDKAIEVFNEIEQDIAKDENRKFVSRYYLHKTLFELHDKNQGSAREYLLQAFETLMKENRISSIANEYWWTRFGSVVIDLGYGSWLLAVLEEKGFNIVLSPYYTAIQALEIEKQDSKNGQKDAEIYLKNRAVEISEPARMIIERMRKYIY